MLTFIFSMLPFFVGMGVYFLYQKFETEEVAKPPRDPIEFKHGERVWVSESPAPDIGQRFFVTMEEMQKINEWLREECYPAMVKKQKEDPVLAERLKESGDPSVPLDGSFGGWVTYTITPTGLGVAVHAVYAQGTDQERKLDLTEEW